MHKIASLWLVSADLQSCEERADMLMMKKCLAAALDLAAVQPETIYLSEPSEPAWHAFLTKFEMLN